MGLHLRSLIEKSRLKIQTALFKISKLRLSSLPLSRRSQARGSIRQNLCSSHLASFGHACAGGRGRACLWADWCGCLAFCLLCFSFFQTASNAFGCQTAVGAGRFFCLSPLRLSRLTTGRPDALMVNGMPFWRRLAICSLACLRPVSATTSSGVRNWLMI